jgi:hypothetical protein
MFGDQPPSWLRWANTATARSITTIVAFVALIIAGIVGLRQQDYITCVADQQSMSDARTRILAAATDNERAADTALVQGEQPGGPMLAELRQRSIAARAVTDLVRKQNPPPPLRRC